ncbi:MAG: methyltransferase [Acidimicrobiales bacterium]|nr:methyltransferase [Acidimicrobiales bacterium]
MPSPQPSSGDHYFSARPAAPSRPGDVQVVLPEGVVLGFATDRGTFSPDRLDPGTELLLHEGPPVVRGTLVDLGCGWGPIAVALARRAPEAEVWAVDVNERSRDLCAANAAANGVGDRVRVATPDDVPADLLVDQLWSNPPIRVGKALLHDLLRTWLGRLRPGSGTAELVVHKHLGADSLARWLRDEGWPTERRASSGGYRLLHVAARP